MTECNQINIYDAKKLFDEHQQLYLDLESSNLGRRSILFFCPEIIIDKYKGYGDYFDTIVNLNKYEIKNQINNNVLYLSGIKITNNKIYTEQELGQTIYEDILTNYRKVSYHDKGNITGVIFNHFILEEDDIDKKNSTPNSNTIIPIEIIDSIKKIEKLEVEIFKEKNKILNSNYVKTKLNNSLKNIDNYINLLKLVKNNEIKQFF